MFLCFCEIHKSQNNNNETLITEFQFYSKPTDYKKLKRMIL